MSNFLHLLYGFIIASAVMVSPGMLNMTALKISLDVGRQQSVKFSLGAVLVIFIQVGIALFLASYFVDNEFIIRKIETVGIFIFLFLAVYFFRLSKKKVVHKNQNVHKNYFIRGGIMACLDLLTIPFYVTVSTYLVSKSKLELSNPDTTLFMFGVMFGAFLMLNIYVNFAEIISKKESFITKNMNLILSGIFLLLALSAFVKLVF